VTTGASLSETVTNTTNTLVMVTADALGNADTSFASTAAGVRGASASAFGVDKTAPVNTQTGTANQTTTQAPGTAGNITATITDALSGPAANQLVAQVALNSAVTTPSSSSSPANNTIYSNVGTGVSGVNAAPTTGCIIGRYNRTSASANADTLALPIFNASGTQIGTCSPVPYALAAGAVSSNAGGSTGYVTTRIVAVDQAGNRAAPTTIAIAEDGVAPTVGALDMPTSATGGSSLTVPAAVSDNVDAVASAIQLTYLGSASTFTFQYPQTAGPGVAFDNVLTTSGTATSTIAFFARNLEVGQALTAFPAVTAVPANPSAATNGPNQIKVGAFDQSNNVGISSGLTFQATTSVSSPSSSSPAWSSQFTGGMTIGSNFASIQNCPTSGCAAGTANANGGTATITVTASGVSGTFANPFTRVDIWYQVAGGSGTWFLAGTASAGLSRDTGVNGNRFWDYTFSFTPPKSAQRDLATGTAVSLTTGTASVNLIGIGYTANGDGLITPNAVTIALTNP
jgi:hypothetical protein